MTATRMLVERPLPQDRALATKRPNAARLARSVTVNLAESPLSWLKARALPSQSINLRQMAPMLLGGCAGLMARMRGWLCGSRPPRVRF